MKILVLMAGIGSRFKVAGYKDPKPLIDVDGVPMIERVIENLTPKYREHQFVFVTLSATSDERLTKILRSHRGTIIELPYLTEGAVESALKAENLITEEPLLLSSCDQLVGIPIDDFIDACWRFDGGLLTHPQTDGHFSFSKVVDGLVTEVAERKPISTHANIGPFFFKRGTDFVKAAKEMMAENFRVNGEFYCAPVFNWLIRDGKKIVIHEITQEQTHMLGTPEELGLYLKVRGEA